MRQAPDFPGDGSFGYYPANWRHQGRAVHASSSVRARSALDQRGGEGLRLATWYSAADILRPRTGSLGSPVVGPHQPARRRQRAADLAPILAELRAQGITTQNGIAAALNARGVPTARGGAWSHVQVGRLLEAVNPERASAR